MSLRNEYPQAEENFIQNPFVAGNAWYPKFERPEVVNFLNVYALRITSRDYEEEIIICTKFLGK